MLSNDAGPCLPVWIATVHLWNEQSGGASYCFWITFCPKFGDGGQTNNNCLRIRSNATSRGHADRLASNK